MKHIAFIGDSFCASYNRAEWESRGWHPWQLPADGAAWPSLVADRVKMHPHYHGYCGKSWWYSRHQFYKKCLEKFHTGQFDVIIFCHTDHTRANCIVEPLVNLMPKPDTEEKKLINQAQNMWKGYIYDDVFQQWCQNNWVSEIKQTFKHVPKIIQFTNFNPTLFNNENYHGMCYTTPLITIQVGQYTGTESYISNMVATELQSNHMSNENNIAMADLVTDAINNYQPGLHEIDLKKFHIVNPNAINWCYHQPYGTE